MLWSLWSPRPAARPLVALGWALLFAAPVLAGPADPLLKLVPPNASLCLVVQDLRTHVRTAAASPFAEWVRGSGLGERATDGPELKQAKAIADVLLTPFGVTPDELLDDVFGDAVVFAYRPGPPDKPGDDAGIILVRPRKPAVLANLIGKLNGVQTLSGELKTVREATHRGRAYTVREKAGGGAEFYLSIDGAFAFSGQEAAVRAVIDRAVDGGDSRAAAGVARLGLGDKAVSLWADPRAFDADLAAKVAAAPAADRAGLETFRKLWAASDAVGVFAHPGRGLDLGAALAVRRADVPAELVPILLPGKGHSAAWAAVPADALVAVGGRADVPKVLDAVAAFLSDADRKGLRDAVANGLGPVVGKDKLAAVLAGVGPDWAAWATAPAAGAWLPRWTLAVRLADAPDGPVTKAVTRAVDLGFQLARVKYNQTHDDQTDAGELDQSGVTVRFLENGSGFPAGFRPCFAVKAGFLLVAGSPDRVAAFDPMAGKVADPPLARVSGAHLRGFVAKHREALVGAIAAAQKRPRESVAADLAALPDVLAAVDAVELRYTADGDLATFTLAVTPVKPLAK